jgi:menaquinone-dependent protoporphyrinogen IX oxidase
MDALVLFRSYYGNTKEVAEVIVQQIRELGHEAAVHDLRQKMPDLSNVDFIMIGAPTRIARVSRKAKSVLKKLRTRGFATIPLAIFDTYGPVPIDTEELEKAKKWLYPGAAGIMHKLAGEMGLNVYENTLRCEVKGVKGPLADNALEEASEFTRGFVSYIEKKT